MNYIEKKSNPINIYAFATHLVLWPSKLDKPDREDVRFEPGEINGESRGGQRKNR